MIIESLKFLFTCDLNRLQYKIEAYHHEANMWKIEQNISNSAGNLCLHLIGNLNHFIGAQLGNTEYIRNRELEFSLKNIPSAELIENSKATAGMVETILSKLTEESLKNEYSRASGEGKMSTLHFLIHYIAHLDYHVGQINYHRRLLDI